MPIRKIKSNERKNGMKYCTFCKPSKVNAIYRNTGVPIDEKIQFACENHYSKLTDWPKRNEIDRSKNIVDEHYTEADYQTWLNIH